jgi:hypothetical protein
MVIALALFILVATGLFIKPLCLPVLPVQPEMQTQNFCCRQNEIAHSQYKKNLTVWELGKNKFI